MSEEQEDFNPENITQDKSSASIRKDGIKGSAIKKVTDVATENAPESVQKTVENVQKVTEKASRAAALAAKTKAVGAGLIKAIINPFSLAVIVIAILAINVTMIFVSTNQVIGKNENADGCFGIGTSVGSFTWDEDYSDEERANAIASWLMTTQFEFMGGKPFSKEQAAGALGNIKRESGWRFAIKEGGTPPNYESNNEIDAWTKGGARGIGLIQWTHNPGRAKKLIDTAREMNMNWYDPEPQLRLFQEELDNGSYGKSLNNRGWSDPGKSVEDYVKIFHDVVEISADKTMDSRNQSAREFLSNFNGPSGTSGGSCLMGSNLDMTDVVNLAVSISYPTLGQSNVPRGTWGKAQAKPEYIEAKEKAMAIEKDWAPGLYASCDRFVATVIKLTVDEDIPWGSTTEQGNYLKNSPKWQQYTTKSEAEPGDIWVTKTNGHIVIYIGEYNGQDSIAHASYEHRVAGIGPAIYLNENLVDMNGRPYYGYRFIG